MIQPEVKAKIIEAIQAKKAISFTYQKIDEETGLQYPTSRTINPFVLGRRSEKNLVLVNRLADLPVVGFVVFIPNTCPIL
jgi:predicted DNA-binding transcriptional regulator YafY